MGQQWQETDGETTYKVQLTDSGQFGFSEQGPGGGGLGPRDGVATLWIEEFSDSHRWQNWVDTHLGEGVRREIEEAVAAGLDDLDDNRQERLTWLFTQLNADTTGRRERAVDRIRSVCQRYPDLVDLALPKLADCLDREEDAMRRAAAEALRRLADTYPAQLAEISEALVRGMRDDVPATRMESARALERVERVTDDAELLAEIVDTLASLLVDQTSLYSRGPVAGLLGGVGRRHPRAVVPALDPLVSFVDDSSTMGSSTAGLGRSTALYALIEIGGADFAVLASHQAIFFDQIDADRSSVRRAAAQGLGLIGAREEEEETERAIAALVDRLDDKPFVRQEASEALRAIHAEHPEPVEDALGDRAEDILSEDELDLVAS